ncbi:MAG TPA: hypothetical protein VFB78_07060 [Acidimicrobiales bacterium]|nr:hypothetical protein [Acidimicrobiales bacterium]
MARQRTTFGKLQRAADKQAKAKAKQEKRAERAEAEPEPQVEPAADQAAVLEAFAELHTAYEDGRIPRDEFESRRELLSSQMRID